MPTYARQLTTHPDLFVAEIIPDTDKASLSDLVVLPVGEFHELTRHAALGQAVLERADQIVWGKSDPDEIVID